MHENCLRTKHVQFVRIVSNEAKWICLDWFFRPHNEKRALGQCRQHGKVRLKVKYKTHNSKFKLMNLGRAQFEFFFSSYFANNDARCYRRATTTLYTYQYEWCREDNELSRKNLQSKISGNLMKCPSFLWIFVLVQMQRKKDCKNFTLKTDDKAHKWLKTPFSKWIWMGCFLFCGLLGWLFVCYCHIGAPKLWREKREKERQKPSTRSLDAVRFTYKW